MSLDDWRRAGRGTLRALDALRRFATSPSAPTPPPQPRVVERWVAWHPDSYECLAGATAEEAWMHAMQYTCDSKESLIRVGWRVSLVQSMDPPR